MKRSNEKMNTGTTYLIPNFRHVSGVHCTSSAIRDVFEFHGVALSEAMVFGLGRGLGLGYGKLGSKNPIIGGRQYKFEDNLCKLLNINLNKFQTTKKDEGWLRLKDMLENNIPAAINLDMAYLDYQELPEDFHFGQHAVVVAGYNPQQSTVLIADTQFPDIKKISLEDLTAARNSSYDRWMDPRNFIYEFTFPESLPDFKDVIPNAIRNNGKNILKKSRMMRIFGMTGGLAAISKFSQSLEMLPALTDTGLHERCEEISGFISEYGTGGGLFRYLYSQFLNESAEICNDDSLVKMGEFYKRIGDQWEKVSQHTRKIPESSEHEINHFIQIVMDILKDIRSLELEGARKLQAYSG